MEYLKPHHENQDQGKQSITPESWPPIKYPYHLITEKGIREGEKKSLETEESRFGSKTVQLR